VAGIAEILVSRHSGRGGANLRRSGPVPERSGKSSSSALYFVVKDHPFSDGNKRSAAALFTYYLSVNSALHRDDGEVIVSPNALAAITLMMAMSKPEENRTIIQLVTNMLGDSSDRN
jgi:hypothetical protein